MLISEQLIDDLLTLSYLLWVYIAGLARHLTTLYLAPVCLVKGREDIKYIMYMYMHKHFSNRWSSSSTLTTVH